MREEEKPVPSYRSANADAELIHGRARLLCNIPRRVVGVEEVICGVQQRAVPYLVHIAVKLVRPRLGEVVHLRRAVAPLIDRVGVGVDGRLLQGVETDYEVGREPDVQPEERIVRIEAVQHKAVRGRRQAVELDVAIAARRLGVVRRARGIHQRALGKLGDIGEVLAGIRQILDRLRLQRRGGVRIFKAHQPGLLDHFNRLRGRCQSQGEVHRGSLAHRNAGRLRHAGTESRNVDFNPVCPRIHLGEEKASLAIALDRADRARIHLGRLDLRARNRRIALVLPECPKAHCWSRSAR